MGTAIALLVISIGIIAASARAINREKKKQNHNEDYNFAGILNSSEEHISDYQIEIGKLRKEFAETLLDIQEEIVSLEDKIDKLSHNRITNSVTDVSEKDVNLVRVTEVIKDNVQIDYSNKEIKYNEINSKDENEKGNEKNGIKIKEVEKLMDSGLTIDEISDALQIGKGEVLLIKELYLK